MENNEKMQKIMKVGLSFFCVMCVFVSALCIKNMMQGDETVPVAESNDKHADVKAHVNADKVYEVAKKFFADMSENIERKKMIDDMEAYILKMKDGHKILVHRLGKYIILGSIVDGDTGKSVTDEYAINHGYTTFISTLREDMRDTKEYAEDLKKAKAEKELQQIKVNDEFIAKQQEELAKQEEIVKKTQEALAHLAQTGLGTDGLKDFKDSLNETMVKAQLGQLDSQKQNSVTPVVEAKVVQEEKPQKPVKKPTGETATDKEMFQKFVNEFYGEIVNPDNKNDVRLVMMSWQNCPSCAAMRRALNQYKDNLPFKVKIVPVSVKIGFDEKYYVFEKGMQSSDPQAQKIMQSMVDVAQIMRSMPVSAVTPSYIWDMGNGEYKYGFIPGSDVVKRLESMGMVFPDDEKQSSAPQVSGNNANKLETKEKNESGSNNTK